MLSKACRSIETSSNTIKHYHTSSNIIKNNQNCGIKSLLFIVLISWIPASENFLTLIVCTCISLFEFPCQEGRCAWQNTDNLFLYFLHVVIFQRDSFPQTDSSSSLVSNFAGHLECLWEIVAVFVNTASALLLTPQLRVI